MSGLLQRLFPQPVTLHRELPPRDRLRRVFAERLAEPLLAMGFQFDEKDLRFRRERGGDLVDTIDHRVKTSTERATVVRFHPIFSVCSRSYAGWYKLTFQQSIEGIVWASGFFHQPGMDRYGVDDHWYELGKYDDERLMRAYTGNLTRHFVPLMDRMSAMQLVMDLMRREGRDNEALFVHLACMLGREQEAVAALARFEKDLVHHMDKPHVAQMVERNRLAVAALTGISV